MLIPLQSDKGMNLCEKIAEIIECTILELCFALREAKAVAEEVPVGAVIAREGEVIATGRNRRENANSLSCRDWDKCALQKFGWRLNGCDIYALELCPCAGAIINARFDRVIFTPMTKSGFGSLGNLMT